MRPACATSACCTRSSACAVRWARRRWRSGRWRTCCVLPWPRPMRELALALRTAPRIPAAIPAAVLGAARNDGPGRACPLCGRAGLRRRSLCIGALAPGCGAGRASAARWRMQHLEAGCLLYTTFEQLRNPSWATATGEARSWIETELSSAIEAARRIGATRLVVLGGADPGESRSSQLEALVDNLLFAADLAGRSGMIICLETLDNARVPGMLLHHIADAYAVVQRAAHPCVRLVFDTAHVHAMDGDVARRLNEVWDAVEVIQVADSPGRLQPGTGEVDIRGVLQVVRAAALGRTGRARVRVGSPRRGKRTIGPGGFAQAGCSASFGFRGRPLTGRLSS